MKFIITIILLSLIFFWYNKPVYVQDNPIKIEDLANPEDIEKAIQKMGPYYQYIVETDSTLKVKLEEKWLVLRY